MTYNYDVLQGNNVVYQFHITANSEIAAEDRARKHMRDWIKHGPVGGGAFELKLLSTEP